MSDLATYRIDRHSPTSPDNYGVVEFREGQPYTHVGVLVPDTRLQAIADEYQKYGWEDGFGEVKYLLDALVERGNP